LSPDGDYNKGRLPIKKIQYSSMNIICKYLFIKVLNLKKKQKSCIKLKKWISASIIEKLNALFFFIPKV